MIWALGLIMKGVAFCGADIHKINVYARRLNAP